MLVLTRTSKQKIIVGKNIVVTILKVNGDQVSIGIEAPKDVQILREEVYLEVQRENEESMIEKDNINIDITDIAKKIKVK